MSESYSDSRFIPDGGEQSTGGTYHAECVCGWSIDRDSRAANLPAENNARIVRQVADVHENRPRFGTMADETHVTTVTATEQEGSK